MLLCKGSAVAWMLVVLLSLLWGKGGDSLLAPSHLPHQRRNPAAIPQFLDREGSEEEDGSISGILLARAQGYQDPDNHGFVGADSACQSLIRDRGNFPKQSLPLLGCLSLRGGHQSSQVPPPKIRRPHRLRRSQNREAKMEDEDDDGEGLSSFGGEESGGEHVPSQEVESLLSRLLAPDTSTVRSAEGEADSKMESVSFSVTLLGIALEEKARLELRQMAASILKRSLPAVWERMPSRRRSEVLEAVAASVMSDTTTATLRRQMAVVLGAITPLADSFMMLHSVVKSSLESCGSDEASKRLVSLELVLTLLSCIGKEMRPFAPEIFSACVNCLVDVSSEVQRAAISLACYAIQRFDDPHDTHLYSGVLEPMHRAVARAEKEFDGQTLQAAFDGLADIAPFRTVDYGDRLESLVDIAIGCATSERFSMQARESASLFLTELALVRGEELHESGKDKNVARALLSILIDTADDDDVASNTLTERELKAGGAESALGREEEEEEGTPKAFAFRAYRALADSVCASAAVAALAEEGFIPAGKGGAVGRMLALRACAEGGMAHQLADVLSQVVADVVACLSSSDTAVRKAAGGAMAALAGGGLKGDLINHHALIIPHFIRVISDEKAPEMQEACSALEEMCKALGKGLAPHLKSIMASLNALLSSISTVVRVAAINVVGCAASAAKAAFEPYAAYSMKAMLQVMRAATKQETNVRAAATMCAASIACACSRSTFEPFLVSLVSLSVEALASFKDDDLRVASLHALANAADRIGPDFSSFLSVVMPEVLDSAAEVDGIEDLIYGKRGEDDDSLVPAHNVVMHAESDEKTSGTPERAAVAMCIKAFATACGSEFGGYARQCIDVLDRLAMGYHPEVRRQALGALSACVAASYSMYTQPMRSGSDERDDSVHSQTENACDAAVMSCILALRDEDDAKAVARAFDCLGDIAVLVGPRFMADYMKQVFPLLKTAMEGKSECMKHDDSLMAVGCPSADDLEDVYGAASQCIVSFARAFSGPRGVDLERGVTEDMTMPSTATFDRFLDDIFPCLLLWVGPNQGKDIRRLGLGTMAQICNTFNEQGSFDRYARFSLPLTTLAVRDASGSGDWRLARNAAFYLGEIALSSSAQGVQEQCAEAVSDVVALASNGTADGFARDNAAACLAKIMVSAPHCLDEEDVPAILEALVKAVPLRSDTEENSVVVETLNQAIRWGYEMSQWISEVVERYAQALAEADSIGLSESAKQAYVQGLNIVSRSAPEAVKDALDYLPETVRKAVEDDTAENTDSSPIRRHTTEQKPTDLRCGRGNIDNRIVASESSDDDFETEN